MANDRARDLRSHPTDAEAMLWARLRRRQLDGHRFRRQQPIGPYIVDFFCPAENLIIEVDGGQHGERKTTEEDARRTGWLERRGYRVLRFWNNQVLQETDSVLDTILAALGGGT